MIRAVLFDAVGTLIHLREPVGAAYARLAGEAGVALSAAAAQAAFEHRLRATPPAAPPPGAGAAGRAAERAWWRALVGGVFTDAGAACDEALFARLFDHFGGAAAWRCADGAAALLGRLRAAGLRTGMVSNFDYRLPPLLDALGLAPLLEVVVLPADAGAAKPDPHIFALALARLQVAAGAALYVGDDAHADVAGAQRAGLRAVDVTTLAGLDDVEWLARGR